MTLFLFLLLFPYFMAQWPHTAGKGRFSLAAHWSRLSHLRSISIHTPGAPFSPPFKNNSLSSPSFLGGETALPLDWGTNYFLNFFGGGVIKSERESKRPTQ